MILPLLSSVREGPHPDYGAESKYRLEVYPLLHVIWCDERGAHASKQRARSRLMCSKGHSQVIAATQMQHKSNQQGARSRLMSSKGHSQVIAAMIMQHKCKLRVAWKTGDAHDHHTLCICTHAFAHMRTCALSAISLACAACTLASFSCCSTIFFVSSAFAFT